MTFSPHSSEAGFPRVLGTSEDDGHVSDCQTDPFETEPSVELAGDSLTALTAVLESAVTGSCSEDADAMPAAMPVPPPDLSEGPPLLGGRHHRLGPNGVREHAPAGPAWESIDKRHIQELKALVKPPAGVDAACACMLYLLAGNDPVVPSSNSGGVDVSWRACTQAMSNPDRLLQAMRNLPVSIDAGRMVPAGVEKARQLQDRLGSTLAPEVMRKKSVAAAAICEWSTQIISYYDLVTGNTSGLVIPVGDADRTAGGGLAFPEVLVASEGQAKEPCVSDCRAAATADARSLPEARHVAPHQRPQSATGGRPRPGSQHTSRAQTMTTRETAGALQPPSQPGQRTSPATPPGSASPAGSVVRPGSAGRTRPDSAGCRSPLRSVLRADALRSTTPERHNCAEEAGNAAAPSEFDRTAPAMSPAAATNITRLIRKMERDHAAEVSRLNAEMRGMQHEVAALRADFAAAMRATAPKPSVPLARPATAPTPPTSPAPMQSGVRPVPPVAFAVPTALAREVEQLRAEVRGLRERTAKSEIHMQEQRRAREVSARETLVGAEGAEASDPIEPIEAEDEFRGSEDGARSALEVRAQVAALDRRVEHTREAATAARAAAEEVQAAVYAQLRTTRLLAERLGVGPVLLGRPRPDVGLGEEAESLASGIAHAWRRQKAGGARTLGAPGPGGTDARIVEALRRKAEVSTSARRGIQPHGRGCDSAPATPRAAVDRLHGPDVPLVSVEGALGGDVC